MAPRFDRTGEVDVAEDDLSEDGPVTVGVLREEHHADSRVSRMVQSILLALALTLV